MKVSSNVTKINQLLAEQKKKFKPTQEIEKKVEKQLKPVFAEFYPSSDQFMLFKKYRKNFFNKIDKAQHFLDHTNELLEILSKGMETCKLSKEKRRGQRNFFLANCYLQYGELIGTTYVNYVILLLIGSGIDFHLEPDRNHRYTRHATTLEDIESPFIPLSIKLDFLCSNKLDFFSKMIDRNLRNKIAHLDFEIDQNGDLLTGKKKKKKVDLLTKIKIFNAYFYCASKIFVEELKRTRSAKAQSTKS